MCKHLGRVHITWFATFVAFFQVLIRINWGLLRSSIIQRQILRVSTPSIEKKRVALLIQLPTPPPTTAVTSSSYGSHAKRKAGPRRLHDTILYVCLGRRTRQDWIKINVVVVVAVIVVVVIIVVHGVVFVAVAVLDLVVVVVVYIIFVPRHLT